MSSILVTANINDQDDSYTIGTTSNSVTTTGSSVNHRRIAIGTSEETTTIITDVTGGNGPGYCYIKNRDATNFVDIGHATTVYPQRLDAGGFCLMSLASGETQLFMKADTAACDVDIYIRER